MDSGTVAETGEEAGAGAGRGNGAGRLYVVATPIGHLSDLSPRAARTLCEVDLVAAEDTRVTRVLLRHAGSGVQTLSLHAHNEHAMLDRLIAQLLDGRSIALVSDAGTPAISDPGHALVAAAHRAGILVVPIPGPSAVVTLLSAAGLSEGPFLFEGFLPAKARARDDRLMTLSKAAAQAGASVVFYEAPHRIAQTLPALADAFGADRRAAIGRELTKTFEEVHVCALGDALAWLQARPERTRGEFVVAVDRAQAVPVATDTASLAAWATDPDALLTRLMSELPLSRAVKLAEELTGMPHRALYARALEIGRVEGAEEGTGAV